MPMAALRVLCRSAAALLAVGSSAPLSGQASGQDTTLAPVATRHLPRGTVLSESDIGVARVVMRGAPSSPTPEPGWIVRRPIRSGEVLRPPAVAPSPWVARGDSVDVQLNTGALRVSVRGIALAAGTAGDSIPARLGPKRIVHGLVTGRRQLTITSARIP